MKKHPRRAMQRTSIEAHDECRYAKRADAAALRIPLLDAGDILGNVLNRWGVLKREPVTLALNACSVDENARVGGQAGKRQHDVLVQFVDLAHRPWVLKLCCGFALHGEDNMVGATHADSSGALADSLHGIFDLKEMPVWRKDGDRTVVACHELVTQRRKAQGPTKEKHRPSKKGGGCRASWVLSRILLYIHQLYTVLYCIVL